MTGTTVPPDLARVRGRRKAGPETDGRLDFADTFLDPAVPLQVSHLRLQRSRQLLADASPAEASGSPRPAACSATTTRARSWTGRSSTPPARTSTRCACTTTLRVHLGQHGRLDDRRPAPKAGPTMWWAATTPVHQRLHPGRGDRGHHADRAQPAGTAHGTGPNPERATVDASAPGRTGGASRPCSRRWPATPTVPLPHPAARGPEPVRPPAGDVAQAGRRARHQRHRQPMAGADRTVRRRGPSRRRPFRPRVSQPIRATTPPKLTARTVSSARVPFAGRPLTRTPRGPHSTVSDLTGAVTAALEVL